MWSGVFQGFNCLNLRLKTVLFQCWAFKLSKKYHCFIIVLCFDWLHKSPKWCKCPEFLNDLYLNGLKWDFWPLIFPSNCSLWATEWYCRRISFFCTFAEPFQFENLKNDFRNTMQILFLLLSNLKMFYFYNNGLDCCQKEGSDLMLQARKS